MFELITLPNTYYQATAEKLYASDQALFVNGGGSANGGAPPQMQHQNGPPAQPPPPPPTQQQNGSGGINSAAILAAAAQALAQAQTNSIIAQAAAQQQHSSQSSSPGNTMHVGPNQTQPNSHSNSIHESSHSHSSANTSPANSIHQQPLQATVAAGNQGPAGVHGGFFLGGAAPPPPPPPAQAACFPLPTGVPGTEPSNAGKCHQNDNSVRTTIHSIERNLFHHFLSYVFKMKLYLLFFNMTI